MQCLGTDSGYNAVWRPLTHTRLQEGPQGGLTFRGLNQGGRGWPQNRGPGRHGERVLLLGKRDLHGVVLGDLEALQGVSSGPCLHLTVKLHEGDVVPPRNQPDLLEPREPERKAETSGIQPQHCPQTFKNPVSRDQECC